MSTELTMLGWTLVLAVVQIALPAIARGRQYGFAWAIGPRDAEMSPPSPLTGRLDRALRNLLETLPIFAAAVVILALMGKSNSMTVLGSELYLGARIAYIPAYASGIPGVRSTVWGASIFALLMLLRQILT
jgi:uncharacterized MAPEG superfamily protein